VKNNNINIVKDSVTIIGEGVKLDGKLISKGNVRIDGIISGDIHAEGNITVGVHGEIIGEIKAQVVIIGGKIDGTVDANEKIILESTSKMKGDLITKILVVEEGAVFDGKSAMNSKDIPAIPPAKNVLLK
jgi:cytoskeletal protein CcmA (bactofilin family)